MMKRSIIGFMAACIIATGCNAAQKTDEFTTKSGKTVKITCIKHASLEITSSSSPTNIVITSSARQ